MKKDKMRLLRGASLKPSDAGPGYSESEFLIPARDARGHYERCWFNIPGGYKRQIHMILNSKKVPYRTESDLHRHALHRHLSWLLDLEGGVPSVMQEIEMANELLRREQFHQETQKLFASLDQIVASYLGEGATDEAKRTLGKVRHLIERMPEGYWRDKSLKNLEKYSYLGK